MSELGMRTRPVMASSFTWDVCHGPALSDIPSLANAALQVQGQTKNNWELPVAQQRARAYRNFGDHACRVCSDMGLKPGLCC